MNKHSKSIIKVLKLAKAMRIKVYQAPDDGDGTWYPTLHKIRVDRDLEGLELLGTLLHELGHAIDDLEYRTKGYNTKLHKAYHKAYTGKCTRAQLDIVVHHEAQAWYYGRKIAEFLRIPLGIWYDQQEKTGLSGYKALL